ncbi:hypothetical protein B0J13DRAFT_585007 [Dactylonectria estremocensis]|uniref:Short-chain dehydrogenase/reductase family protein n=1 Tax=Dactylonectria estremocensis TaxID=1079267 RepID=A0A9P9ESL1_9HYPO|nr:hypothetical protein B0J13DRAFT_585007 [Dactylonectria estremocensis]
MSASLKLGPPKESPRTLFLKAQFRTSPQLPPKSTNLDGKVAIVTGSTSGLGLEASRQLLSFGLSTLIVTARSMAKGEQVASHLRTQYPRADIKVWPLEMEHYDSIQAFARRAELCPRLDMAILNAGTQIADFTLVPTTGHEKLVQVNYLSTMLLAILLLPVLKAKSPEGSSGRLTIVSSGSARGAVMSKPIDQSILSSLDDAQYWNPFERYPVSKLLGHMFMINLARRVSPEDVIINLVDPGLVKGTDLQSGAPLLLAIFFYCFKAILGRTVSVGASTYIDAAVVQGKETHGCNMANWVISPFAGFVYTPDGELIREQLWGETMAEFGSYGAQAVLDSFKN